MPLTAWMFLDRKQERNRISTVELYSGAEFVDILALRWRAALLISQRLTDGALKLWVDRVPKSDSSNLRPAHVYNGDVRIDN